MGADLLHRWRLEPSSQGGGIPAATSSIQPSNRAGTVASVASEDESREHKGKRIPAATSSEIESRERKGWSSLPSTSAPSNRNETTAKLLSRGPHPHLAGHGHRGYYR